MSEKTEIHYWTLGLKYQDLKRNRKIPGKAKVYLQSKAKFRMDVYDPFGFVQVGSVIMNGGEMLADFMNQETYRGPVDREKIKELLRFDVNPDDLISLFTQTGFEDKHWECSVGSGNLLKECESAMQQVSVKWSGLMSRKGTLLELSHPKAKLKLKVNSYKAVEAANTKLFDL